MGKAARIAQRIAALMGLLLLLGCGEQGWYGTDITGAMPPLRFFMARASDGANVTANDYRGKLVVLYFGYTHCPDICPATLANIGEALQKLGADAPRVSVLFVTVDPNRDTLPILKTYVKAFAPQMDALRGGDNAIADLARRCRVAYSVTAGPPYQVMHSDAVFLFDPAGRARIVTLSTDNTAALADDMKRLLE
ncbi:MAG TPA: SCO family protein [Rhizomicrobium sp.]|nr:SCO family protein [Rhizomicrobium sp.]